MRRHVFSSLVALVVLFAGLLTGLGLSIKTALAAPNLTINTCSSSDLGATQQFKEETLQCEPITLYSGGYQYQYNVWQLQMPFNASYWDNYRSGLRMEVTGSSTNEGARIVQYYNNGGSNQHWNLYNGYSAGGAKTTSGQVHNVNSSQCMGVLNGATNWGAWIIQWGCNGNADQNWSWVWTGEFSSSGYPLFYIVNSGSQLCIGIDNNGSTAPGAHAVQWDCNGNSDQKWF